MESRGFKKPQKLGFKEPQKVGFKDPQKCYSWKSQTTNTIFFSGKSIYNPRNKDIPINRGLKFLERQSK